MELKKAKSQADNQIRSLEAAHSAKDRALQQKQAEVIIYNNLLIMSSF